MDKAYLISIEWSDILIINNDIIRRQNHNDKGLIKKKDKELIILWDKWGEEHFIKNNEIYFKKDIESFNIFVENKLFNDYCIINSNGNINTTNYEYSGEICFKNDKIEIHWYNYKKEYYYLSNYGRNLICDEIIKFNDNKNLKNIKNIAIIFPQYHEIPENNKFWGKGFTEWTLLKKTDEYIDNQIIKTPHKDIGFYNLNDYDHRKYIEKLANLNNIYGFCYYHYWFKNKKVMYEPLELMIDENNPNKPFMFCWANEQWTRKWDGGNQDVLIEQDYSDIKGNIDHFNYLLDFFKHKNYIKIENKPVFIFYRIEEKDKEYIENIINLWNELSIKNGFTGVYFMRFLGPFDNKVKVNGIKSFINFQPGFVTQKYYDQIVDYSENKIFNEDFDEELYLNKNSDIKHFIEKRLIGSGMEHFKSIKGSKEENVRLSKFFVFDGKKSMDKIIEDEKEYSEQHLGIFTGWNNSPRRNYKDNNYSNFPHYYKNIDVDLFGETYEKLLHKINDNPNNNIDFLFISAWNEWNEQAMLEPNNEDGYDYLNIINDKYNKFYGINRVKNILFITHKGGGTEKYTKDLIKLFINYNFEYIDFSKKNYDENYRNIDTIHINSFLYSELKNDYVNFFKNNFIDKEKIITIHDYQWLYPEDPNIFSYNFNKVDIKEKNINDTLFLFSICKKIIFPSFNILKNYDLILKLNSKFSDKIIVVNHPDIMINNDSYHIRKIEKVINIAFIGYFCNYKGSQLFKILINNNKFFENKKIIYHIFGNLSENENNNKIDDSSVIYHNQYSNKDLMKMIEDNNIHGICHLSIFEESYCYTLSYSINSGIPIFYLDHGSFTERLSNKDKYFPSNLDNIKENFKLFLNYLINNNNIKKNIKNISKLQISKWYVLNY